MLTVYQPAAARMERPFAFTDGHGMVSLRAFCQLSASNSALEMLHKDKLRSYGCLGEAARRCHTASTPCHCIAYGSRRCQQENTRTPHHQTHLDSHSHTHIHTLVLGRNSFDSGLWCALGLVLVPTKCIALTLALSSSTAGLAVL